MKHQDRSPRATEPDRFCANCGERIGPDAEAAEVYCPADDEVTSRLIHAACMRPDEEIA